MPAEPLDVDRLAKELIWQGQHFNLLADKQLSDGIDACEKLDETEEGKQYEALPVDRVFKLPKPITLFGHSAEVLCWAMGNVFLVFRGKLARAFAAALHLEEDDEGVVPRPSGLAGALDVYVENADGSLTVVDDADVEALVSEGKIYDRVYACYSENPGSSLIYQRWLIAYESSRFPGFTMLGTVHGGYWTEEARAWLRKSAQEQAEREQAERDAIDAEINTPDCDGDKIVPNSEGAEESRGFIRRRRQRFLTANFYAAAVSNLDDVAHDLRANLEGPNGDLDDKRGWAFFLSDDAYQRFSLHYTAGEPIEQLRSELTGVIEAYERYQRALGEYEGMPKIAPFTFAELYLYERCMQLIGLCYLLHRRDLLPRIAALQDPAYAGDDTLYEDLLAYEMEERFDVDEWHHDEPYRSLINCLYGETETEQLAELQTYLRRWYPAFKYAPWHDGHLRMRGTEGDYFGYWAFEAGAVAYLLDLNDSAITHMVYPKDLVAWARANKHLSEEAGNDTQQGRCEAGQPCPREGFWFTPAQAGSRRFFKAGEVMPEVGGDYGTTIWQWDQNQEPPKA